MTGTVRASTDASWFAAIASCFAKATYVVQSAATRIVGTPNALYQLKEHAGSCLTKAVNPTNLFGLNSST